MKMRTQITKICISFLLFCSYSFYAWGQSKLDDVIISNIKVEKEIASLKSQLDIYNDSIKKVRAEIANSEVLLKKVMHQKDSLEYKKSKDFLAKLNKEVISLDSINNTLLVQIKDTKIDLATKYKKFHSKVPHLHRWANRLPATSCLPAGALPRHRLASSAPGGASALSMACRVLKSEHDHACRLTLVTANPPLRSPIRSMAKYRISSMA